MYALFVFTELTVCAVSTSINDYVSIAVVAPFCEFCSEMRSNSCNCSISSLSLGASFETVVSIGLADGGTPEDEAPT